jgi:predicted amidophosphoribosyltransferase
MQTKITFVHLCRLRSRPDAACRRPGWGNCSRCGAWRELIGGGKGFRFPRLCAECTRKADDQKGGAQ